jgi:hypothetical protein
MQRRGLILVAMFSVWLGVAGCGTSSECTPGQQSTPGAVGDPCDQTNQQCLALQGRGIALCMPDGAFGQCVCTYGQQGQGQVGVPPVTPPTGGVPPVTTPVTTPPAAAAACGNNLLETGEACERGSPVTLTCESMLGPGARGLVMCVSCKFDFSMCQMGTPPSGGSGAAMPTGGTGARP